MGEDMNKQICLNRSVLDFMASKLTRKSFVIEFGGGWSSPWFADRCGNLIVVETSHKWARTILNELEGRGHVFVPRMGLHYVADVTRQLSKATADLVLIDGFERLRYASVLLAWPRLKPGGWLVFDDAQREQHKASIDWLCEKAGKPTELRYQEGDVPEAIGRLTLAWRKP